jgi:hypothetical protein
MVSIQLLLLLLVVRQYGMLRGNGIFGHIVDNVGSVLAAFAHIFVRHQTFHTKITKTKAGFAL